MGRSAKAAKQQKQAKQASAKKGNTSTSDDMSESMSTLSVANGTSPYMSIDEQRTAEDILASHVARTCTGVLSSIPSARDIKIEQFSLQFHGLKLIENTNLELTIGRRYGLLGANGSGKSTFMKAVAARELPIPEHTDIFLLNEEFPKTPLTAVEAVLDEANKEIHVSSMCLKVNDSMQAVVLTSVTIAAFGEYVGEVDRSGGWRFSSRRRCL
jgi:ATP-binding cassette subfamily F protein 2